MNGIIHNEYYYGFEKKNYLFSIIQPVIFTNDGKVKSTTSWKKIRILPNYLRLSRRWTLIAVDKHARYQRERRGAEESHPTINDPTHEKWTSTAAWVANDNEYAKEE